MNATLEVKVHQNFVLTMSCCDKMMEGKRMQMVLKQSKAWTSPDSESDPSWRSVTPGLKNSPWGSQEPRWQRWLTAWWTDIKGTTNALKECYTRPHNTDIHIYSQQFTQMDSSTITEFYYMYPPHLSITLFLPILLYVFLLFSALYKFIPKA